MTQRGCLKDSPRKFKAQFPEDQVRQSNGLCRCLSGRQKQYTNLSLLIHLLQRSNIECCFDSNLNSATALKREGSVQNFEHSCSHYFYKNLDYYTFQQKRI